MKTGLVAVVALAALLAIAGCDGGSNALGDPAGGDPSAEGPDSSGGSNPFFVPGGDAGGDETPGDPTAPPATPPKAAGTGNSPPITCFEKALAEGEIGSPYSSTIEVTGGSGGFTYELTSGELPAGLTLAGDGTISGTPTEAAMKTLKVRATDSAGKKKTCAAEITIRGDLELNAVPLGGAGTGQHWDVVYKVTTSDNVDDISWAWTGDTANVCANITKPDVAAADFRTNCSLASLSGNIVYIWLKADQQGKDPLTLTLTVTSPYAQGPANHDFVFNYSRCGNGIVEGDEECDGGAKAGLWSKVYSSFNAGFTCNDQCVKEKIPAPAKSIEVTLWTGEHDSGGTNCDVGIVFCKDNAMSDCENRQMLDHPDIGDRERGSKDVYAADDGLITTGITEEHRYFDIQVLGNYTQVLGNCGGKSGWLLRGIRIDVQYRPRSDGTTPPAYTYFNPCVEKWIDAGDALPFGPNDTAVCAIIETADYDDSGTNDMIWLIISGTDVSGGAGTDTSISDAGPSFVGDMKGGVGMLLDWIDYGDSESSDKTSYGDYYYDANPFKQSPSFSIQKSPDGEKGGWIMAGYEILVFHPGTFLDEGPEGKTVLHAKKHPYITIEDETSLTYSGGALKETAASVVTEDIGGHL